MSGVTFQIQHFQEVCKNIFVAVLQLQMDPSMTRMTLFGNLSRKTHCCGKIPIVLSSGFRHLLLLLLNNNNNNHVPRLKHLLLLQDLLLQDLVRQDQVLPAPCQKSSRYPHASWYSINCPTRQKQIKTQV